MPHGPTTDQPRLEKVYCTVCTRIYPALKLNITFVLALMSPYPNHKYYQSLGQFDHCSQEGADYHRSKADQQGREGTATGATRINRYFFGIKCAVGPSKNKEMTDYQLLQWQQGPDQYPVTGRHQQLSALIVIISKSQQYRQWNQHWYQHCEWHLENYLFPLFFLDYVNAMLDIKR